MFLSSGGQPGAKFTGQFLKNGWTKKNPLIQFVARLEIRIILKKWAQSVHSSRSYSKYKAPYQMDLEERYTTFRAKIEHLNSRKRYIKYTYSETTLDRQSKTVIFIPELIKFKASRSHRMLSTASRGKIKGNFTGQFLWNGGTKINALNTVCSTAWDTHQIKKWAQSVHSLRSYSNYKVPYQMTKKRGDLTSELKFDMKMCQTNYT